MAQPPWEVRGQRPWYGFRCESRKNFGLVANFLRGSFRGAPTQPGTRPFLVPPEQNCLSGTPKNGVISVTFFRHSAPEATGFPVAGGVERGGPLSAVVAEALQDQWLEDANPVKMYALRPAEYWPCPCFVVVPPRGGSTRGG